MEIRWMTNSTIRIRLNVFLWATYRHHLNHLMADWQRKHTVQNWKAWNVNLFVMVQLMLRLSPWDNQTRKNGNRLWHRFVTTKPIQIWRNQMRSLRKINFFGLSNTAESKHNLINIKTFGFSCVYIFLQKIVVGFGNSFGINSLLTSFSNMLTTFSCQICRYREHHWIAIRVQPLQLHLCNNRMTVCQWNWMIRMVTHPRRPMTLFVT